MLPVVQIGPFSLQTAGLVVLAAVWIGLDQIERHSQRFGIDSNRASRFVLITLLAGLLGARLAYVLHYLPAFRENPLSALTLKPVMMDWAGGLGIAVITGLVYGQRKGYPLWPTLDALTPGLAVMAVAIGLANLASGSAFGIPTRLPWGIPLWGAVRHPTQIYETILASAVAFLIWPKPGKAPRKAGVHFLTFVALSAGVQLVVETFRDTRLLVLGELRGVQLIAWLVLAACLWLLGRRRMTDDDIPARQQDATRE